MTHSLRRRAHVATAVLVALTMPLASVLAHGPDPLLAGDLYAQNKVLEFEWQNAAQPAWFQGAVLAGAADSNGSKLSKAPAFTFKDGSTSFVQYGGNVVCGVNGLACMRRDTPNGFRMYFRAQGHAFDWGVMRWCEFYEDRPDGCYDTRNVALDEFGHVHILGHHVNYADERDFLDSVVQEFSRVHPEPGYDEHVFGRCDVATLQREYGLAFASTKISTCLDLETSLGLTSSVSSGRYNQPVTLTATLRIVDLPEYERLGGQALSSRIVAIDRRVPGGTWSRVATMTASTPVGTYVFPTTIRYTAEYRAVFVKPAGEGLRAKTSATVTVRLSCTSGCPQSVPTGEAVRDGEAR